MYSTLDEVISILPKPDGLNPMNDLVIGPDQYIWKTMGSYIQHTWNLGLHWFSSSLWALLIPEYGLAHGGMISWQSRVCCLLITSHSLFNHLSPETKLRAIARTGLRDTPFSPLTSSSSKHIFILVYWKEKNTHRKKISMWINPKTLPALII